MNDFNIDVSLKIFTARKKLNMSRAELGKRVNLHESTIKRYEDGHIKSIDIDKLKEFANALDISPAYLMGWEECNSDKVKNTHKELTEDEITLLEMYRQLDVIQQAELRGELKATIKLNKKNEIKKEQKQA